MILTLPICEDNLRPDGGVSARRIRRDVDSGPGFRREQSLTVGLEALHARLEQAGSVLLLHGQPGDIVDQRLLGLVISLQASVWISHTIGCIQLFLHRLLFGGATSLVLPLVHAVLSSTGGELERGPGYRIRVVGDPAGTRVELQWIIEDWTTLQFAAGA